MGSWGCFCFAAISCSQGLSTRQSLLALSCGTEAALCSFLVHQPGPEGGFISGTRILLLGFPYYSIFV